MCDEIFFTSAVLNKILIHKRRGSKDGLEDIKLLRCLVVKVLWKKVGCERKFKLLPSHIK